MASSTNPKCKAYLESGKRMKNAKKRLEKWTKNLKPETREKILANTKIGRKREKAGK